MVGRDPANTGYTPVATTSLSERAEAVVPEDGTSLFEPVVGDGILYALPVSDGAAPRAIDLATGEQLWQFERGSAFVRPTYGDGRVVLAESNERTNVGVVRGVDARTGREQWTFDLGGPAENVPKVADGIAYIAGRRSWDSSRLFALEVDTGDKLWERDGGQAPGPPAIADGSVFASGPSADLVALDAETGARRWSVDEDGFRSLSSPTVFDGVIVVGGRSGIRAYDACTGDPLWRAGVATNTDGREAVRTTPVVADGSVYAFATRGQPNVTGWVYGFGLEDGERRWKTPVEYTTLDWLSNPVVSEDDVFLPTHPGNMGWTYVLDRKEGAVRRELDAGGDAVLVDSHLLVSNPGGIHVFELG